MKVDSGDERGNVGDSTKIDEQRSPPRRRAGTAGQAAGPGLRDVFRSFLRRAPQQSRSRALVDALLSALEERLATPEEHWRIEDVIERAGVGTGSFYEYFSTKDAMLGALVGRLTERNFDELLKVLDDAMGPSLHDVVDAMANEVARRYLGSPGVTRAALAAIARFDLLPPVTAARDRFADELAVRASRFYPDAPLAAVAETMRAYGDSVMGIIVSEVVRHRRPDPARWAPLFAQGCMALLAARHGRPTEPGLSRDQT